jgi:hypothetical protein
LRIFPWRYVSLLRKSLSLLEVVIILSPWIDDVVYPGSPFLRQIASFTLRRFGGSSAPRVLKELIGGYILQLNSPEDIRAAVLLSIVEAYRAWDRSVGTDLASFLAWRVPLYCSRHLLLFPTAANIQREEEDPLSLFEGVSTTRRLFEEAARACSVAKQKKRYYSDKMLDVKESQ